MKIKKPKIPNTISEAAPVFAVFGTVGLLTYIGYKLYKNLKFDINLDDLDYDEISKDQ